MEGLLNKAEFILDKSHEILVRGGCGHLQGQPLFNKLAEIYTEEASKTSRLKNISSTHHLLEKLTKRDNLNSLIVNLYRGNEGYSLAVKLANGTETETVRLQYEDEEFLSYLDNEQLPPMLLDLFDNANIDIFYSGCIITEIRDFRRAVDTSYESRYILLKPTNQSIAADVANLTRDKDWTAEEKLLLEAEIVRRTAPPLQLSPSPIIGIINNKVHQHVYKFSGIQLRKAAKRFSQISQNRQKEFEQAPPPKSLKLYGFLSELKDKRPLAKSVMKPMIPLTSVEDAQTSGNQDSRPSEEFYQKISEDVKKLSQPLDRSQDTIDNSLVFIEEYTLETERGQGRIYLTKLTILQRRTDEIYFGELYVDRDYQEGKQNGSICRFQLGTIHQVQRYIKQFKEILTEEGRKTVKITHKVAGQPPRVAHTPGMREKKDLGLAEQLKQQQHPFILQQQQQEQKVQQQEMKQGVIGGFNLGTPQSIGVPMNATSQNVILVSNTDGSMKKTLNVVTKPITVTSTTALTNLIAAPPSFQQGALGQQLVVGQGLNLSNLLNSRKVVVTRGNTVTGASGTGVTVSTSVPQGVKLTAGLSTGNKISLPALTSQLSYAQATPIKCQTTMGNEGSIQVQVKPETIVTSTHSSSSNLEALLAGSSCNNSETISSNAALLERLSAQSIMLNTPKMHEDPSNVTSGNKVTIASSHQLSGITTVPNTSSVSSFLRAENAGIGPPNINLANITNLPGLNVGLQNLASNLTGIQNVQVSFPGFSVPIPITLSIPTSSSSGSTIIVTSPSPSHIMSKPSVTTSVTSSAATTVMIANPSALQQGQVVQLPIGQLSGSQLAKSGAAPSSIPVLQVQGVSGQLFTSVRGASVPSVGTIPSQAVQVAVPASQLTMSKQPSGQLTWQLQQKLMAAKRQQQHLQQQQNQQQK